MAREDTGGSLNYRANAMSSGSKHGPTYTGDSNNRSKMASKSNKKLIRLATVLAYVLAVSLAAIVLAIYYIFVWDPNSGQYTQPQGSTSASGPEAGMSSVSPGRTEGHLLSNQSNTSSNKTTDITNPNLE